MACSGDDRRVTDAHPNVTRVATAAAEFGLTIAPRRFPEGTKTAADAAAAIGVDVGQIVKSLIFAVDGEVVLAYVSGSNQLDEKKLAHAAGGSKCARVDADTVYETTGFPIGGVPPFGHTTQLRVFIDPGPAAVRRGLGRGRHVARRLRAVARRSRTGQRRNRDGPPAGVTGSVRRAPGARSRRPSSSKRLLIHSGTSIVPPARSPATCSPSSAHT